MKVPSKPANCLAGKKAISVKPEIYDVHVITAFKHAINLCAKKYRS